MTLQEAARILEIETLPETLLQFEATEHPRHDSCDLARIERLEREYGMLGEYFSPVLSCLEAIEGNEALKAYTDAIVSYLYVHSLEEAGALPIELPRDAAVKPYYLLTVLCALIPRGIEEYRARGFSEEEIHTLLDRDIRERVALAEGFSGEKGLPRGAFGWLMHYATAQIFRAGIFNITPRRLRSYEPAILLRNKESGAYAVVLTRGDFHRSGMTLGSGGCKDAEGAFDADFCESEDAFVGRRIADGLATPETVTYPKRLWEVIAKEGDGIVGIHIPRGAALTKVNVLESFESALKLSRERYPEVNVRAIHCATWMLDPQLKTLVGEESKLAGFLNCFLKYPVGGDGSAVYYFVFQTKTEELSALPENTTLQRKIKSLYLDGGCIYINGGFVADDAFVVR
jgi:hypothetical protein